jgi:aryl-alcohol dehydrogenase-like predicted oxidoreductase
MKIAIGTVQFGVNYGISNKNGKSNKNEVSSILKVAENFGIDTIDTAALYGDSEQVLGEILDKHSWKIITKSPHFNESKIRSSDVTILRQSIQSSLKKLNQDKIYGFLVHDCNDLLKPGWKMLVDELNKFKSEGVINKIGVSVYSVKQIDHVLDNLDLDLIQLPVNIFDQNLHINGYLKKIKQYNIEIHARSVFLQGLLLMKIKSIPLFFKPIEENFLNFYDKAEELSMSQLELALNYVSNIDEVDKVIVGVNNKEQLIQIIKSNNSTPLGDLSELAVNDRTFTDPSLWKL